MKTFIKFVSCHIVIMYRMFLLMGGLIFLLSSCETEIIPDDPENEITTLSAKERNFSLAIRFANFGEADSLSATRSMESVTDTLSSAHSMEPETDMIRLKDDLFIFATLAVDPADKTPAVTTRKFQDDARIRVVAYKVTVGPNYTQVFDEIYDVLSSSTLKRESSTDLINLDAGKYKLVAYSYNNTTVAPPAYGVTISGIDPVNDLIWGESDTTTVYDGGITYIPIKMYHKLSQVKLVATTGPGGPPITVFSGVSLPGYTVNLTTLDGALAKNTAISQAFTFTVPAGGKDTVISNTRTVYTGTPGDIPTVIHINTLTAIDTTLTDVSATFAKSLRSGYSYTMTMRIGASPDITDNTPAGFNTYVGAFWKAGQTGERLIRLPRMADGTIDSVWTAQVIEGRDWILLDTLMTTDQNVWNVATEPAVDDANLVSFENNPSRQLTATGSSFVSGMVRASTDPNFKPGNDRIYFRIGLRNKYTPTDTKPVRYGIVLLTYGNNKYRNRIWIRQGEEADYLMRRKDAINSGGFNATGPDSRPAAIQFSPYNLTVQNKANFNTAIYGTAATPDFNVNPSDFTDYPTQSGAFFQWASNSYTRVAWDAYNSGVPSGSVISSWNNVPSTYWNTLGAANETCPSGYRRPTDGATNAQAPKIDPGPGLSQTNTNVLNSEFRQSLYLNPQTGITPLYNTDNIINSIWGYYADGFFDRRQITSAPGYQSSLANPKSTVAASLPTIANVGRLFYNINTNASIFFPASGNRYSNEQHTSELFGVGDYGFYWSSSAAQSSTAWAHAFIGSSTYQNDLHRTYGFNVRCVKNPSLQQPDPVGATICFGSAHTFTLAAATGGDGTITYQWEQSSDNANWSNAAGTSTNATYTTPNLTSAMYYRRKATAGSETIISASALVSISPCNANTFNPDPTKFVNIDVKVDAAGNGTTLPIGSPGVTTKTLTFLTFNLGANPSLSVKEQMAYPYACPTDITVYGGWYQWGRKNVNHTFRCDYPISDATKFTATPVSISSAPGSATINDPGQYVYGGAGGANWTAPLVSNSDLWGNGVPLLSGGNISPLKGAEDPCPAGWRVPSEHEWALLGTEDGNINSCASPTYDGFTTGVATLAQSDLYWVKVVNGYASATFSASGLCGYALYTKNEWNNAGTNYKNGTSPLTDANAPTPLLFLPAAGYRDYDGGVRADVGSAGLYWSGTVSGSSSMAFLFVGNAVQNLAHYRAWGQSVRCVKESLYLNVNPAALNFDWNATGTSNQQTVTVTTDLPNWTTSVVYGSGNGWLTLNPTSGSGATFTVVPNSDNPGSTPRTATITVTAGGLTKTVTVTQNINPANIVDSEVPTNATIYVGAFWKANQTGERLIRIPRPTTGTLTVVDGAWTATVIVGNDWITLDNLPSNDPNYAYSGPNCSFNASASENSVHSYENSSFDALYPVGGGPTVSGTATATVPIYFRIGLKSRFDQSSSYSATPNFTTTFPARYGVVLLTYGTPAKTQRIWIRQGHDDDYLMRPSDGIYSGGLNRNDRPAAVRFLPYNTTWSSFNTPPTATVQWNNGTKTLYPSQAGAFFQWAALGTAQRVAWDPYDAGNRTGWGAAPVTYWTDAINNPVLKGTDETCPPGYRRPADGVTNAPVGNINTGFITTNDMLMSEMRQSLYLSPNANNADDANTNANSVWGYYADGFFDRRAIGASFAVSTANSSVAYIGRLFFNNNNNASVFFPAAGNRGSITGALSAAGIYGFYWSSSAPDTAKGWSLLLYSVYAKQDFYDRTYGFPVRCVRP